MAQRGLLSILNDPAAVEAMLAKRFGEMRSHELSPTEQIKYNVGKLQDPGTPGDKRDIYRRAEKQVDVASTIPPVGTALGMLDAGYAARQYREGETSLPEAAVGVAGGLLLPKLKGAYHGTSSPRNFTEFVRSNRDMGTHVSTDPNVARGYAMGDYTPNKFAKDWKEFRAAPVPGPIGTGSPLAGPRVMPVVADIRKPMKYPGDPVNWQKADNVLETLEGQIMGGAARSPHYIDTFMDLKHVAGKPGKWEGNFEDYLRGKKYDAVQYPHVTRAYGVPDKMNSYMALDPEQILPRFSPEGQALIKQRGLTLPSVPLRWSGMDQAYWDLHNQGIMGKKADNTIDLMQKGIHFDQDAPAGAAINGLPSYLHAPIMDVLSTTNNTSILNKKLADMSQMEYKIYSGALTTAENIVKHHTTPKKYNIDDIDKQLAGE